MYSSGTAAHSIGEVQLIFTLPPKYGRGDPLVYVHLFNCSGSNAVTALSGMHRVQRQRYTAHYDEYYVSKIVPLSSIRRTCHLILEFNQDTPQFYASSPSALVKYDHFYVNTYLDSHTRLFLY
jgi:hypothetical protein